MGDRRPAGEKEFNPLDDALDLIGRVMEGQGTDAPQQKTHPLQSVQRAEAAPSVATDAPAAIHAAYGGSD